MGAFDGGRDRGARRGGRLVDDREARAFSQVVQGRGDFFEAWSHVARAAATAAGTAGTATATTTAVVTAATATAGTFGTHTAVAALPERSSDSSGFAFARGAAACSFSTAAAAAPESSAA